MWTKETTLTKRMKTRYWGSASKEMMSKVASDCCLLLVKQCRPYRWYNVRVAGSSSGSGGGLVVVVGGGFVVAVVVLRFGGECGGGDGGRR